MSIEHCALIMFIGNWPMERALITPEQTACKDLGAKRNYTWREFSNECDAVANYLYRDKKINYGDRIVVIAENSAASLSLFFASLQAGAVFVPIDPYSPNAVINKILSEVRPKLIFFDEFASGKSGCANAIEFSSENLLSETLNLNKNAPHITEVSLSVSDPACIIFTPDEIPVGIVISHSMIYYSSVSLMLIHNFSGKDNVLGMLNFSSPAGLFMRLLPCLFAGGSVSLLPSNKITESILKEFPLSDTYTDDKQTELLNFDGNYVFPWAGVKKFDLNEFKERKFKLLFPCVGFDCFYLPKGDFPYNALGFPSYNIQPKIGDSQSGLQLPEGEIGELFFRGSSLFSCFWNHPKKTSESFLNGWLRTGVMAYCKNGFYFLEDKV